jgi:hypothetical protein
MSFTLSSAEESPNYLFLPFLQLKNSQIACDLHFLQPKTAPNYLFFTLSSVEDAVNHIISRFLQPKIA